MPEEQRIIHVWAENQPGVLMRVANTITAKGANIDRLMADADPLRTGISKIVIVATLETHLHRRVVAEMNRLVNVLFALDVTEAQRARTGSVSVRREAVA
jgi:acetolactate synthase small subunit